MVKAEYCPYCGSEEISELEEADVKVKGIYHDWSKYKCEGCGLYFVA